MVPAPPGRRRFSRALVAALPLLLLASCVGSSAVPDAGDRTDGAGPAVVAEPGDPCAAFAAQVWAQTVFDADPRGQAALDPDGDGVACAALPPGAAPTLWAEGIPPGARPARLLDTIDGDTIAVETEEGRRERVRLLAIDAPETGQGSRPRACFGREASDFAGALLARAGGTVSLERDVEDRDRFGRLLRYVWFEADGAVYLANEAIVRAGYAGRSTYPPNLRYDRQIGAAERFARRHGYGLWRACAGG